MIYNFISSKQVISKVLSDLDIDEESFRIADCMEWAAEAIEKIGSVRQLDRKISGIDTLSPIEIVGHQAQLPIDLFRLNSAAYSNSPNGPWIPMTISSGTFNMWSATDQSGTISDLNIPDAVIVELVQELFRKVIENPVFAWFNKMDLQTALQLLNTDKNLRVLLTNLIKNSYYSKEKPEDGIKYSIKPGYIVTNVPTGYIKLSYDSLHLDSDGFPMIPNLISYIEATYWYITMKLKYPDYLAGRMNRETYYDIRRSWNFYCKQAYAESMMPNQDELESIKNSWNKLIPDVNANENFYADIDQQQRIKTL